MVIKAVLPNFALTWTNFTLPIFVEVSCIASNNSHTLSGINFTVHAHDVDFNDRLAKYLLKKYQHSVAFKIEIDLLLIKATEHKVLDKQ